MLTPNYPRCQDRRFRRWDDRKNCDQRRSVTGATTGMSLIRLAIPDDISRIKYCAESAYALYVERMGKKPAPMVADFGQYVRRQTVHILEVDKSLAGFIICFPKPDHFRIENIAVAPDYQQCGYGRQLMAFAETGARASGFSRIELYTNEKMWENLKMYPVLGYQEFDRRIEDGFARVFFRKFI